jgi:hypothetical protein
MKCYTNGQSQKLFLKFNIFGPLYVEQQIYRLGSIWETVSEIDTLTHILRLASTNIKWGQFQKLFLKMIGSGVFYAAHGRNTRIQLKMRNSFWDWSVWVHFAHTRKRHDLVPEWETVSEIDTIQYIAAEYILKTPDLRAEWETVSEIDQFGYIFVAYAKDTIWGQIQKLFLRLINLGTFISYICWRVDMGSKWETISEIDQFGYIWLVHTNHMIWDQNEKQFLRLT